MEKKIIKADTLPQLARTTVEEFIKNRVLVELDENSLKEYKNQQAGVFVTIYKKGNLRGCIGTIGPVQANLLIETIQNAISSCCRDHRFNPVEESELQDLKYSVNVLMPPEPINSTDSLDPHRYGVIVTASRNRRGLLLPRIESINTVEEQMYHVMMKAGINPSEEIGLYRFESIEHKED